MPSSRAVHNEGYERTFPVLPPVTSPTLIYAELEVDSGWDYCKHLLRNHNHASKARFRRPDASGLRDTVVQFWQMF